MEIDELRSQIDAIDDKIAALYLQRMEKARLIGEKKKETGKAVNVPGREKQILARLTENVADEELKGYVIRLYKLIFSMSKAYQSGNARSNDRLQSSIKKALEGRKKLPVCAKVACQGVEGSYSNAASDKLFEAADITYFKTFDAVFSAVEKGLCAYGILPIENSSTGSVVQVYDLMRKHKFFIVDSVRIHVKHALAVKRGAEIGDIKTVCSHEQGLRQCAEFIKSEGLSSIAVENTAVAARTVAESDDISVGAICSPAAAEIYGLQILRSDVQDNRDNYTRFICVSKQLEIHEKADKISIVVGARHTPGSLQELLGEFSALGLNLTKLESRPVGNSDFEFLFYFDFEADIADERVAELLGRLSETAPTFEFLGSYGEKL